MRISRKQCSLNGVQMALRSKEVSVVLSGTTNMEQLMISESSDPSSGVMSEEDKNLSISQGGACPSPAQTANCTCPIPTIDDNGRLLPLQKYCNTMDTSAKDYMRFSSNRGADDVSCGV